MLSMVFCRILCAGGFFIGPSFWSCNDLWARDANTSFSPGVLVSIDSGLGNQKFL